MEEQWKKRLHAHSQHERRVDAELESLLMNIGIAGCVVIFGSLLESEAQYSELQGFWVPLNEVSTSSFSGDFAINKTLVTCNTVSISS